MALTNLLLLNYNNYYNRKLKHPPFRTDSNGNSYNVYTQYPSVAGTYTTMENVNFFKGDNVSTTLVANIDREYDYVVEYEAAFGKVLSRWFIIENKNVRSGQASLTLKRDTLVDFYDVLLDAPAFIEKATVPVSDVAIYNQEPYQYNEIKQSQTPIKDRTNNAWIVGYFVPTRDGQGVDQPINFEFTVQAPAGDLSVNDITTLTQYTYANPYKLSESMNVKTSTTIYNSFSKYRLDISFTGANTENTNDYYVGKTSNDYKNDLIYHYRRFSGNVKTIIANNLGTNNYNTLSVYNNRIVKDTSTNRLYKIQVNTKLPSTYRSSTYTQDAGATAALSVYNAAILNYDHTTNEYSKMNIVATYSYSELYVNAIEVSYADLVFHGSFAASARYLQGAPYKMFCLPLYPQTYTNGNETIYTNLPPETMIDIASKMATQMGSQCYDIQLLPYYPLNYLANDDGTINITNELATTDYTTFTAGNTTVVINFGKAPSFTFDIDFTIDTPNNPIEAKIARQCHKYRLASPNSAAFCDFNEIATGSITKLNVDCTYKPYSPYIHINPDWHGLYGRDYNTPRGLVCQGDFSLPVLNDNWVNYQLNNKNYLNSFNREVDSIELNNKWSLANDITNAIAGTAQGAAAGATAGMSAGGPVGAAVGAAIGGVASAAGGVASVVGNNQLRKDALDKTKTQFNYSMQNIQAQPRTLAKNSAFDANNQIWAYIEFYDATPQEHNILRNNLKYNGFTINRIGTINEFITYSFDDADLQTRFYKGAFIQIPDLEDDFHLANDLANEFHQGFYHTQEV